MGSVDDRIVRMEFENASFEKKVGTTLSSLGSLNTAIATVGDKNGLDNVKAADSKFSLPGVTSAIDGISLAFGAMATVGITALANITNRAIDAGISLGKSLSLDQIISGFDEYEINMNSIQTILANTRADGTNLEQVNSALDDLNDYSDKTIYNFATMTKNIGSATAAGVDLETATSYVKGFANSAAVAGVDANAMGGALEQMSQALGSGVIKAQDWISLEKRGLAGQVQQKAFFDMAKAMGTMADVPIDQSFEDWTAAGNTLRGSLSEGWLTSEVFLNTMKGFGGEMDAAALAGLGFTDEMIPAFLELGEIGVESATKVRTLTQLVDTVKEAVGSGWSVSFRTVFGDFEEATVLFTDLNDAFSGMAGESADARNKMLQDWKDLGGRTLLIDSVKEAFQNLGAIFKPIREGFRNIFPKRTGEDLYAMTETFSKFAKALKPSKTVVNSLKVAFTGFFAAIKGVSQIIGAVVKGFTAFVKAILPLGQSEGVFNTIAKFISKIGFAILNFDEGTIIDFFVKLAGYANQIGPILKEVYSNIEDFFKGLDFGGLGDIFGSVKESASGLSFDTSVFDGVTSEFKKVAEFGEKAGDVLTSVADGIRSAWSAVTGMFGTIVDEIKNAFGGGGGKTGGGGGGGGINWALIGGTIATALGGGMVAGLFKIVKAIKNFDITGGFLDNVNGVLDQTRGVLKAVQQDIKADALIKISIAIGILAVALIGLSFVDGKSLLKSMAAVATAFGLLAGALVVLNKIEFSTTDALKMTLLAGSMLLFATAFGILGLAAKLIGTSGWEDLGKAGAAFSVFVLAILAFSKTMSDNGKDVLQAGIALLLMAGGMAFMAKSVKKFGDMDYEVMKQGLIGLGVSLLGFIAVFKLLPSDMEKKSTDMLKFGISLNLIALAVKLLGSMDPEEFVQGMLGMGVALTGLVLSMQALDKVKLEATAGKILALAGAVLIMSIAIQGFAHLGWEDMTRGLIGMGVSLGLLVGAMQLMPSGLPGAAAILVIAGAMLLLSVAIQAFAALSFGDFAKGLGLLVLSLGSLAIAALAMAPAMPALILLGVALAAIGIGVAGVGIGIQAAAKGILLLVQVGSEGAAALEDILKAVGNSLPAFFTGVAEGLIGMADMILGALPGLIAKADESLKALLQLVIDNIPGFGDVIEELIKAGLDIIATMYTDFADTGLEIIRALLDGIEENIGPITESAIGIATNFMEAVGEHLPTLIDTTTQTLIDVFTTLAENLGYAMAPMGLGIATSFLQGFLRGLIETVAGIWEWISGFATEVIDMIKGLFGIQSPSTVMMDVGIDLLTGLLNGIVDGAVAVFNWFTDLASTVLGYLSDALNWLFDAGVDVMSGLLDGIVDGAKAVWKFHTDLPKEVTKKLGNVVRTLWDKGWDLMVGLWNGINSRWNTLKTWLGGIGKRILSAVGSLFTILKTKGTDLIKGLWNGIVARWNQLVGWFGRLGSNILSSIGSTFTTLKNVGINLIKGLWNGIVDQWHILVDKVKGKLDDLKNMFTFGLDIFSPSRFTRYIGEMLTQGLTMGIVDGSEETLKQTENMTTNLKRALVKGTEEAMAAADNLAGDISPTIKPVLDLTQVRRDAKTLKELIPNGGTESFLAASGIATARAQGQAQITDSTSGSTEIKFEQTINAPSQLSTTDIYRQTRNQIATAKETLNIP